MTVTRDPMDMPQPRSGVFVASVEMSYYGEYEQLPRDERVDNDEAFLLVLNKSFGDRTHDGSPFSQDGTILLLTGQYDSDEAAMLDVAEMMDDINSRAEPCQYGYAKCLLYNDADCSTHFPYKED